MGKIPTLPQCPVDGMIMELAGFINHQPPWTKIDTIEDHRIKIGLLITSKNRFVANLHRPEINLTLAEWELLHFVKKSKQHI